VLYIGHSVIYIGTVLYIGQGVICRGTVLYVGAPRYIWGHGVIFQGPIDIY
jgi:hypothetical protein